MARFQAFIVLMVAVMVSAGTPEAHASTTKCRANLCQYLVGKGLTVDNWTAKFVQWPADGRVCNFQISFYYENPPESGRMMKHKTQRWKGCWETPAEGTAREFVSKNAGPKTFVDRQGVVVEFCNGIKPAKCQVSPVAVIYK